ncbi:nuclear transport factor 2 family protein [Sphingobacterium sp.]|uniref:nuclear transport factor 2 family protein n=1 Tax=Sphingobacterium sp. TaxID=341027 RepID=UPI0028987E5A|nr:nuclear transport factor 2 family protein [Sphingobacterium sp.]
MKSAKYIVLSFIESLNKDDFAAAYELLDKDMVFEGVLGSRHTADHYIADMKKMSLNTILKK